LRFRKPELSTESNAGIQLKVLIWQPAFAPEKTCSDQGCRSAGECRLKDNTICGRQAIAIADNGRSTADAMKEGAEYDGDGLSARAPRAGSQHSQAIDDFLAVSARRIALCNYPSRVIGRCGDLL